MKDYKTISDVIANQPVPTYQMRTIGPVATLRDQFAMAALTGILMNDNLLPGNTELIPYRASGCAYEIADAMMEARK